MNTIIGMLLIMLVPIFISLTFIPYWTRKTESFGVTIPEEVFHHQNVKTMRRKYAWMNGIVSLITTAIFWIAASGKDENYIGALFTIIIFAYLLISFFIYLIFHRQMKALKKANSEWTAKPQLIMVETGFRKQKLTHSNFWFVIPFLLSIITLIFILLNFEQIPDRFPMQYNFSGEVTTWANKSYRSVLLMPVMQIYLTLLFLFINIMISKAKQQVSAADPEKSLKQNIIFRRRWSLFNLIMGTGLVGILTLQPLSLIYHIDQQVLLMVPFGYVGVVLIATIWLSITTGQGGSRISFIGKGNNGIIDRDDDHYWKLGMFYFNKNDPSIFIEKRFGIGWTNNWAHPLSWIFILVVIFLAAVLPKLLS